MEGMNSWQATDEQLIERARNGDQNALQELWQTHRRWVAAIILAHRPRSIELEDLLQEVVVRLISKVHTLREARAFRPWLRQIALNVCRGAGRSVRPTLRFASQLRHDDAADDRPRTGDGGRISEPEGETIDPAEYVGLQEAARRLLEQAMTLPMTYREPLILRCVRCLSYQQISELLDLPLTTIETRLARARRMLRDELSTGDETQAASPEVNGRSGRGAHEG